MHLQCITNYLSCSEIPMQYLWFHSSNFMTFNTYNLFSSISLGQRFSVSKFIRCSILLIFRVPKIATGFSIAPDDLGAKTPRKIEHITGIVGVRINAMIDIGYIQYIIIHHETMISCERINWFGDSKWNWMNARASQITKPVDCEKSKKNMKAIHALSKWLTPHTNVTTYEN